MNSMRMSIFLTHSLDKKAYSTVAQTFEFAVAIESNGSSSSDSIIVLTDGLHHLQ